jgi:hypothetical protein
LSKDYRSSTSTTLYSSDEGHGRWEQDATEHDEATDFYAAVLLALQLTTEPPDELFQKCNQRYQRVTRASNYLAFSLSRAGPAWPTGFSPTDGETLLPQSVGELGNAFFT